MDISAFYENNWIKLDKNEKIKILQDLEYEMATIQKRVARSVVETTDNNLCANYAEAQYNFNIPENIFLRNLDSGFKSAESIIHEGIHAMYDDAFNGKINAVVAYYKVNVKDLVRERINKSIIYNHFSHKPEKIRILFNLCYIEEKIAHHDSKCFLLSLIENYICSQPKSLKNADFFRTLFLFYEEIFVKEVERINYETSIIKDTKVEYGNEIKTIDYSLFEDKKEEVVKPSISFCSSSILSHFLSQLQIYRNIHNPLMAGKRDENIQKFRVNYESFFRNK